MKNKFYEGGIEREKKMKNKWTLKINRNHMISKWKIALEK